MNESPTATLQTVKQLEWLRQVLDTLIKQIDEGLADEIDAVESVSHELRLLESCWTHTNLLSLMQTVDLALDTLSLPPILQRCLERTAKAVDALQLSDPPTEGIPW